MQGSSPSNKNYNPQSRGPTEEIAKSWSSYVKGASVLNVPAVTDEAVFVQSGGILYGLGLESGEKRWQHDVDLVTYPYAPAVANDTVYFVGSKTTLEGGGEGEVIAVDTTSGEIKWRLSTHVVSSPVISDGTIYVSNITSDGKGYLQAIDPNEGTEEWKFELGCDTTDKLSLPAVTDGQAHVIASCENSDSEGGDLIAVDPVEGEQNWKYEISTNPTSAPSVSNQIIYYTSDDFVHAIRDDGSEEKWRTEIDPRVSLGHSIAINERALFVDQAPGIKAIDKTTGQVMWHEYTDEKIIGLCATDQYIYSGGGAVRATSVADGEAMGEYYRSGFSVNFSPPIVANDSIYAASCVKNDRDDLYDHYIYEFVEN
jgi:outer membrane protein assembly factor BamB